MPSHPAIFRFYVYAYFDPRYSLGSSPVYVGKGASPVGRVGSTSRAWRHWRSGTHNPAFGRWLSLLRREDLHPTVQILAWFSDHDAAAEMERERIADYGRIELSGTLFNLTDGGDGMQGHIPSPEHREKIRQALLGKKHSAERRQRQSESARHRPPISEATREKLRARPRPSFSDEMREKIRRKALARPPVSAEIREKLRLLATGVPKRPETIEKLRKAMLGNKHSLGKKQSAATRAKRAAALLGQRRTPEQIERMRVAARERWVRRRSRH